MSGIGGYVRRKDRHVTKHCLSYDREAHLGRLHHFMLPSGMVMSWRDESPMFETASSPLKFLPFEVLDSA
jgi:hypothetical protein